MILRFRQVHPHLSTSPATIDMRAPKQYAGVTKILRRYWSAYGGWSALASSPYVHISIVLCALTAGFWSVKDWWTHALQVLPNLLGFTLGGFAVFLGFGDEKFRSLIAGSDPARGARYSPYLSVSATFLHFVLLQVVALLWAAITGALHEFRWDFLWSLGAWVWWVDLLFRAVGYWLFIYSLMSAAAAALAVFRFASMFDSFRTNERASTTDTV